MTRTIRCPDCGERELAATPRAEIFEYGVDNPVALTAVVDVFHCADCGLEFTDAQAERARDAAVTAHRARQGEPVTHIPLESGALRFFTDGTWRPRSTAIEEIPTPVGAPCPACDRAIQAGDCGVSMVHMDESGDAYRPWHLRCFHQMLGIEDASA